MVDLICTTVQFIAIGIVCLFTAGYIVYGIIDSFKKEEDNDR